MRIVIVEDNQEIARMEERLLEVDDDARITVFATLAEAKENILQDPPDVVLLDLGLPDSSVDHTLNSISDIVRVTPVVVATAYSDSCHISKAHEQGVEAFIDKTRLIIPDFLLGILRRVAQRRRLVKEIKYLLSRVPDGTF